MAITLQGEEVRILEVNEDTGRTSYYFVAEAHKSGNVRTADTVRFRAPNGISDLLADAKRNQAENARI